MTWILGKRDDFLVRRLLSLEEDGFGAWRRFVAELPSAGDATVHNNTFVLAAERTYRQDPMNGYQPYTGGWNIRNQHYWAVSSSHPLLLRRLFFFFFAPATLHRLLASPRSPFLSPPSHSSPLP
ncbi:unnamed protein product [Musa textilis]